MKAKTIDIRKTVYVLSDSTGNLARHMLTAFLTQFPPGAVTVHFRPFLRSKPVLEQVLNEAKRESGIVCHALVSKDFKDTAWLFCQKANVPCIDLTGGVMDFLSLHTGLAPKPNVDALHQLDETYKQRVAALEFTLNHDDGLGVNTLDEADIVLVGVSRTSKTPTSIYLAQQGYRVANVSLAHQVDPPQQLLAIPKGKAVGFVISPQQLVMIRARRQANWHADRSNYDDPTSVAREVAWSRKFFADRGWPILDVTDQAVEESAAKILTMLGIAQPASLSRNGGSNGDMP